MMGKYVIESKFENTRCFLEVACENSEPYFFINRVDSLTPYTEPDLERVKRDYDAYYEYGYEEGLSDAWEAARKVVALSTVDRRKVFGSEYMYSILEKHTASEAIEKIRQYEQEKDRQARIEYNFDEIKDVLETTAKECNVSLDEIAEVLRKMGETNNG